MNGKLVALFVVISLASLCYARPSRFDQQGLSAEEILKFLSSKEENAKEENAKISEGMLIIFNRFRSAMQDARIYIIQCHVILIVDLLAFLIDYP